MSLGIKGGGRLDFVEEALFHLSEGATLDNTIEALHHALDAIKLLCERLESAERRIAELEGRANE